jgi:hypothetical protein
MRGWPAGQLYKGTILLSGWMPLKNSLTSKYSAKPASLVSITTRQKTLNRAPTADYLLTVKFGIYLVA